MIDQGTALRGLLVEGTGASVLREMIGFAAERLVELEAGGMTGAAHGERNPDRLARRNGCRDRDWRRGQRRAAHPQAPARFSLPVIPAAAAHGRKGADAVIQEACVHGVSTRVIDDLVQAMGASGI